MKVLSFIVELLVSGVVQFLRMALVVAASLLLVFAFLRLGQTGEMKWVAALIGAYGVLDFTVWVSGELSRWLYDAF